MSPPALSFTGPMGAVFDIPEMTLQDKVVVTLPQRWKNLNHPDLLSQFASEVTQMVSYHHKTVRAWTETDFEGYDKLTFDVVFQG